MINKKDKELFFHSTTSFSSVHSPFQNLNNTNYNVMERTSIGDSMESNAAESTVCIQDKVSLPILSMINKKDKEFIVLLKVHQTAYCKYRLIFFIV